jgi:sialic acid synthase SpsE
MLPGEFAIGDAVVGGERPVYVIAEAGANHNRDLDIAHKLIEIAADSGSDAVKFQTYSGDRLYSSKTPRFKYLANTSDKPTVELLREAELPREWQSELAQHAEARGIAFLSTPFDHDAVAELDAIGVPALKIASFEIVDLLLIQAAAGTGRPLLISTGMATLGEIEEAIAAAVDAGARALGLMQCVSVYPAQAAQMNLRAMETMRRAFGVPVGLSDHTEGTAVPVAAAALGAAFIEKHFTLDRNMTGPDHAFALEPRELTAMVRGIREASSALGSGLKRGPDAQEAEEMYSLARRSLIVTGDLPKGTVLERHMLTVKRPGFGIAPKFLDLVVGRELKVDVEYDDVLTWEMV